MAEAPLPGPARLVPRRVLHSFYLIVCPHCVDKDGKPVEIESKTKQTSCPRCGIAIEVQWPAEDYRAKK